MKLKNVMIPCFVTFLFISCFFEEEPEYYEIEGEIVYTDSFSPEDWEQPVMRKLVIFGDMDIGPVIPDDVMDPRQRSILTVCQKLFDTLRQKKEISAIESLFTQSAYNSFSVRYGNLTIEKGYNLRVAIPEKLDASEMWVDYKLQYPTKSYIGRLQLVFDKENCMISDFDDEVFLEIMSNLKEKSKENDNNQ